MSLLLKGFLQAVILFAYDLQIYGFLFSLEQNTSKFLLKGKLHKSNSQHLLILKLKINERLNIATLDLNNQIDECHQQECLPQ